MQRVFIALALVMALAAPARADFTVVALPDTQNYSEDYPHIYDAQTQWVADNIVPYNIRFVSHLGDIVNQAGTLSQWQNAYNSMLTLDNAGMPYGTCVGNHDILYPGDYNDPNGTNYLTYFNPSRYAGQPWFGGASPSGLSNYQIIEVDGQEYLFLHLLIETPPAELAWAQGVLNANQDKPTWVSTHRYLFDWIFDQGRYDAFNYTFEPPYRSDGIPADDFFNNFVAANRQIYLVYCGHNHSEWRMSSTNNFGLTVHEVLADYQDDGNGGDGWLRINTIRPDSDQIYVQSYSPTRGEFRTGGDSQFTLSVDFDAYTSGPPFLNFQQGVAGYSGTQDTWVNQDSSGSSYGGSSTVTVDNDVNNSVWNDRQGQGLFRFDNIFQNPVVEGDPAPTRIPYGATITQATMSLTLKDDVDSPSCGGLDFYVHRMTRDWNEGSTWNSLSGGISPGSDMDSGRLASFSGDNTTNNDYGRTFTVTSAVQSWANGSPNYGFGIISEDINWCDDGIDIYSSEDSNSANRPQLSVSFTYTVANAAPVISQPLQATQTTIGEGEEVDLTMTATDPSGTDPLIFRINGQDVGFATGSGSIAHPVLFEDEGQFSFSGEVEDDEVAVGAGSVTVTVTNLPPVITALTTGFTTDAGRIFGFAAEAADPGIHDTLSAAWDLDADGQFDDATGFSGLTSIGTVGSHVVSVQVSDNDGDSIVGQFTVLVEDLPADGDFDNDGSGVDTFNHIFLDADDEAALAGCMSGNPSYAVENCLSAFDADVDGDVDDTDEKLILGYEPDPEPTPAVPGLTPVGIGALLSLLLGLGLFINRRK